MNKIFLLSAILLFSCKKNSPIGTTKVLPLENQSISKTATTNLASNQEFTFTTKRKTEIEIDETTEQIQNYEAFLQDSNSRVLEIESNDNSSSNKTLKCYTLGNDAKKTLIIDKSFTHNGTKVKAEFMLGEEGFIDYKFHCEIYNDSTTPKITKQIIFHRDLIVSTHSNASALNLFANNVSNKIDHLIFLEKGVLKILDQNILINAKNLIAIVGSQVVTFDSDIDAHENKNGLNGGSFSLFTENALGKLFFNMNGQNAGKFTRTPTAPTHYPEYYNPSALDGLKPTEVKVPSGLRCESGSESCKYKFDLGVKPTSGKNGLKGVKGNKGLTGLNGGNSGIAKIYVMKDSLLEIDLISNEGSGSPGGEGSNGGPGTPGGMVFCDEPRAATYCRDNNITAGAQGDQGDKGESGEPGKSGIKMQSSYINQENVSLNRIF